jgi:protein-tyrosine phosphatase
LTPFQRKTQLLLVCTENICRSPLAEGLLRHHLKHSGLGGRVKVGSAGTRTSQSGSRPDQRAQRVAARAGINLARIRSRRITEQDFVRSDLIVAMDHANIRDLEKMCPPVYQHKIRLLMSYLPGHHPQEVPDPYYGSVAGFDEVFQLIDAAVIEITSQIADQF